MSKRERERDLDRLLDQWMDLGPVTAPERVAAAASLEARSKRQSTRLGAWLSERSVFDQLDTTHQRPAGWLARRFSIMSSNILRFGIAAAAVVLLAFIGIRVLGSPNTGGPAASAAGSPTGEPSPSPTAEPTPGWPSGPFEPGRHDALLDGISFSFAVEQRGWGTTFFPGMIIKGPSSEQRWIAFFDPFEQVSTDPCTGAAQTVGPTIDDLANAMTSIPGTDSEGPTNTTVGGLPAKLVVLTIHDDIGCEPTSFWLYGQDSAYPNALNSVMSAWIVEVDGARYVLQSHHADSDAGAEQEIHQIIDSLQFN